MVATLTANNPQARDNVAPPPSIKEDGSGYHYRMAFDGGARFADADTPAEMLDVLIPGYLAASEDDRDYERLLLAKRVQMLARSSIMSNLTEEQYDALEEWEKNLLLWDGLDDPSGWGDGSRDPSLGQDPEIPDQWNSEIPLVLLDTSYVPFTDVARPLSAQGDYGQYVPNLIFLSPEDELDLLRSLSRIGYISFGHPAATERVPNKAH